MKRRKVKHRTPKFFGHPEDSWTRLGGRYGKKRSYGHFSGMPDFRTEAEKQNADDLRDTDQTEEESS